MLHDVLPSVAQATQAVVENTGIPMYAPCRQAGRIYIIGFYRDKNDIPQTIGHRWSNGKAVSFPLEHMREARRLCDALNVSIRCEYAQES